MYHILLNPKDEEEVKEALENANKYYEYGLFSAKDRDEVISSIHEQVELYK